MLGAGGAARSVVLALARAGAAEVAVVNRTAAKAEAAAALAGRRRRGRRRRSATPTSSSTPRRSAWAAASELPLDPGCLGAGQLVADLVYHPLETPLLAAARAAGCGTVDGLGMLVHQAAIAFELWTGEPAPVDAMRAAALGAGRRAGDGR